MTNLLQRGAAFLADKAGNLAVAGRTVRYSRGPLSSEDINAVCTERRDEAVDEQGLITTLVNYDWTFTTTEMDIRGEQIEPRAGDRITETLDGTEYVYEVMPLPNKKTHEWADTSGIMTVVHTKRIR